MLLEFVQVNEIPENVEIESISYNQLEKSIESIDFKDHKELVSKMILLQTGAVLIKNNIENVYYDLSKDGILEYLSSKECFDTCCATAYDKKMVNNVSEELKECICKEEVDLVDYSVSHHDEFQELVECGLTVVRVY